MRRLLVSLTIAGIAFACYGIKKAPVPGAEQTGKYIHLIEGRPVAIVANQTSTIGEEHLVDFLKKSGIDLRVIFAPEHGFRDLAGAGENIKDGRDPATGVPIISLYGSQNKPAPENLRGIDVVIFDIQDVGVRYYTYLSTLHYVLEACAEQNKKCIILDRPNPNGFYFDGNILDTAYRSFVGMHPVPVVTGMTIGEYGMMINGEGWLKNGVKCDLTVVRCKNYRHKTLYEVPVRPSPNLPNMTSIYLYPSICWFEGTRISLGRGTPFPFQVYGSPLLPDRGFSFIPESVPEAKKPPHLGVKCYGVDLRNAITDGLVPSPMINLKWVIDAYNAFPEKDRFFTTYFDVLAGGPVLRQQIINGMSAGEISSTWKGGLQRFGTIRARYLLYK